jgi:hypothetical protein
VTRPSDLQRDTLIEHELAVQAFRRGFEAGCDPARRPHIIEIGRCESHWLRGFEAGSDALERATAAYRAELLR